MSNARPVSRRFISPVLASLDHLSRRWNATDPRVANQLGALHETLEGGERRAALIALIEAPGGRGTSTASALARALAGAADTPDAVVLADLTLDAAHRALHGIDPDASGLVELAAACRFGPPPTGVRNATIHRVTGGYGLLPGLRRHHDWVAVRSRSAGAVLDALRAGPELVVAHVDRDLEGESDTGSFDVEDRNVLARTAVRAADLVVVVGDLDRAGRQALLNTLVALAAFGTPLERTVVITAGLPWPPGRWPPGPRPNVLRAPLRSSRTRVDRRLGEAIHAALAGPDPRIGRAVGQPEPRRIEPGSLGR